MVVQAILYALLAATGLTLLDGLVLGTYAFVGALIFGFA
jgi:hypothetical protein